MHNKKIWHLNGIYEEVHLEVVVILKRWASRAWPCFSDLGFSVILGIRSSNAQLRK